MSNLPTLPPSPNNPIPEGQYDLLSIRDKDNPDSIINLVPGWLALAINTIAEDTLTMDYESLRKQAKANATEEKLRHSFWNEYKRVIHDNRRPKMSANNIVGGVCSITQFQKIAGSTYKLAYILQPPPSLDLAFDELIHAGLGEMIAIMREPLHDDEGKFNSKLATLKSKLFNDVITRRLERTVNINTKHQAQTQHHHVITQQSSAAAEALDITPKDAAKELTAREIEAAIEAEAIQQGVPTPNPFIVKDPEPTDDEEI
jgi:hypothetical protein